MRKFLFAAGAALALSACVHTETAMLDNRTAMIAARGNAFSKSTGVIQGVLQEAATQAQARGYPAFVVLGSQDQTQASTYVSPTNTTSSAYGNAFCSGSYCSGSAYGNSQTTGGQAYNFIKPGMDVTVRFLTATEAANVPNAWDVAAILAEKARTDK